MKSLVFAALVALALGFAPAAHALPALVDNGGNLIWDPAQNVTWYEPAPTVMTWNQAMAWAAGLSLGGVTGWSLPTTPGTTPGWTNEGEMGYLYYNELGNTAGGPLANSGPFANLTGDMYWSGTAVAPGLEGWIFDFAVGLQLSDQYQNSLVLAVHPGDIGDPPPGDPAPVPVPGAILLFAPGLVGLAAIRRRLKK